MVTDAVETKLQQKLRPGLCAVHPDEPFTYSEKGYASIGFANTSG